MKIQSISSQNFNAKQKYLKPDAFKDMQTLLKKMNDKTTCEKKDDLFESSVMENIKINENDNTIYFYDNRGLAKRNPEHQVLFFGKSILKINDSLIQISNENGEIINCDKPWYENFNKLIAQAEKYLKIAASNFENKNVVVHNYFSKSAKKIDGFGRSLKVM